MKANENQCEFTEKCNCYFDGSWTCNNRKADCQLYTRYKLQTKATGGV